MHSAEAHFHDRRSHRLADGLRAFGRAVVLGLLYLWERVDPLPDDGDFD